MKVCVGGDMLGDVRGKLGIDMIKTDMHMKL